MKSIKLTDNPNKKLLQKSEELSVFIGSTPLFPIRMNRNSSVKVFAKLEWQQFGGSVKSRPAYRIIQKAIEREELTPEKHLLDASSGNTGIAYAQIGAALGVPISLCLPENASIERKQILQALGVDLHFTSKTGGTDEAQEVARDLYRSDPDKYYYADQYNNQENWKSHYYGTGPEILEQTDYQITHFISGLGTTGTFTGTGRRLKEYDSKIQLIGLQPDISMHGLEGWKHLETAHVPGIFDHSLADEVRTISTERALETVKKAARNAGLLISPSSGANLASALQLAEELDEGVVVTVLPDDGSKYGEILEEIF